MKRTVLALFALAMIAMGITDLPAQKQSEPSASAPQQPVESSFGIPLIYKQRTMSMPDGTEIARQWSALIGLINSSTVRLPTGGTAGMRMVVPLWMNSWNDMIDQKVWAFPFPIPLILWGTNESGKTRYVFPVVYSNAVESRSGLSQTIRAVVPLWWSQERAPADFQEEQNWKTRFAMGMQGQQVSWAPALDRLIILLFFHSVKTGFDRDSQDLTLDDWGVIPLTWGWRNEDLSHINLHPLVYWNPDRRLVLFPFYWLSESYHAIVPLWGRGTAEVNGSQNDPELIPLDHEWKFALFPLWRQVTQTRNEGETNRLNLFLWPLFAWGDGGFKSEIRAWPLFRTAREWYDDTEVRGSFALWPLIWWGERTVAGDLQSRHRIAFPLYFNVDWDGVTEDGAGQEFDMLFPLWIRNRVEGETRTLWAPFPLYLRVNSDEMQVDRLAIFLGGRQLNADGSTIHDILSIGFRRIADDDHVETSTLLAFNTDRNWKEDTARVALLWRLFEYTREGDDRGMRLLFLPWRIPLP